MEISILLSVIAISLSVITMWLTLLRKGIVRMTQPTVIFFGPDGGNKKFSKIFFRTLLFATSKKGRVIENMYVRLKYKETLQIFNIWAYGGTGELSRGSGLYVGETGISTNHHFLPPGGTESYEFKAGEYLLEVYIHLIGDKNDRLLHKVKLFISSPEAEQLKQIDKGIYFDWGPDSKAYHSYIDKKDS